MSGFWGQPCLAQAFILSLLHIYSTFPFSPLPLTVPCPAHPLRELGFGLSMERWNFGASVPHSGCGGLLWGDELVVPPLSLPGGGIQFLTGKTEPNECPEHQIPALLRLEKRSRIVGSNLGVIPTLSALNATARDSLDTHRAGILSGTTLQDAVGKPRPLKPGKTQRFCSAF